jgi:hypothetical protein
VIHCYRNYNSYHGLVAVSTKHIATLQFLTATSTCSVFLLNFVFHGLPIGPTEGQHPSFGKSTSMLQGESSLNSSTSKHKSLDSLGLGVKCLCILSSISMVAINHFSFKFSGQENFLTFTAQFALHVLAVLCSSKTFFSHLVARL